MTVKRDAAAGVVVAAPTVKALDVTAVSPDAVKRSDVLPLPVIVRLENVARPFAMVAVVVPESVPLPEAIAAVTVPVALDTSEPLALTTRTTGWLVSAFPETAPPGCVMTASRLDVVVVLLTTVTFAPPDTPSTVALMVTVPA